MIRFAARVFGRFFLTPERGADTVIWLASSRDVASASGGYYVKRELKKPSAPALDDKTAQQLGAHRRTDRYERKPRTQ